MTDSYKDKETLRRLYVEKRLSTNKIGDQFGVDGKTIWYWLDKYGIERRDRGEAVSNGYRQKPVPFRMTNEGYEVHVDQSFQAEGETIDYVQHHRLLATVDHDLDELDGMVVHHKSNIPWDNRPGNLELMTPEDHTSHHEDQRR